MKIAVFGASGRTGQHLVRQALERGHQVVALVRNPARLAFTHPNLKLVQGDVQDPSKVTEVLAGVEAVISVLGPTQNKPVYDVSQGMQNILAGMKAHGIRRLVVSAGAGVADPNDEPGLLNRAITLLVKLFSRYVYEDMLKTVEVVRRSDLDWTIVRVPMLTEESHPGHVKVGWVGKGMGPRLSRAAMAEFMLDQLTQNVYLRQAPAISNGTA